MLTQTDTNKIRIGEVVWRKAIRLGRGRSDWKNKNKVKIARHKAGKSNSKRVIVTIPATIAATVGFKKGDKVSFEYCSIAGKLIRSNNGEFVLYNDNDSENTALKMGCGDQRLMQVAFPIEIPDNILMYCPAQVDVSKTNELVFSFKPEEE
jgi:hypothetical protein